MRAAIWPESAGTQVRVVRNEGSVDLVAVVASLVPADAARRSTRRAPGPGPFEVKYR